MSKMTTAKFRQLTALLRETLGSPEVAAKFAELGVAFDTNGNGSVTDRQLKLPITFNFVDQGTGAVQYVPDARLLHHLWGSGATYPLEVLHSIFTRPDVLLATQSSVFTNLRSISNVNLAGTRIIKNGEADTKNTAYKFKVPVGLEYSLYVNATSEMGRELLKQKPKTGVLRFGDDGEFEYWPATGLKFKGNQVRSDFGPEYDCDLDYLWLEVPAAATKKTATKTASGKFMAYNHNGTELMAEPGTKAQATKELREYTKATGNAGGYVEEIAF